MRGIALSIFNTLEAFCRGIRNDSIAWHHPEGYTLGICHTPQILINLNYARMLSVPKAYGRDNKIKKPAATNVAAGPKFEFWEHMTTLARAYVPRVADEMKKTAIY